MIQVNDHWCRAAVTAAGCTTVTGGITGRLTRTGGRLISGAPLG